MQELGDFRITKPGTDQKDLYYCQNSQRHILHQRSANIASMAGRNPTQTQHQKQVEDEMLPANSCNIDVQFLFGLPGHQARMDRYKLNITK